MAKGDRPIKNLNSGLILSALVISSVIFGAGVFAGYNLNSEKMEAVEANMQSVTSDVQNFQLQMLFFDVLGENASCPFLGATMSEINKKSYDLSSRLMTFDSQQEIKDEATYTRLKSEYMRLLTSYWLLAEKLKTACTTDTDTILYFYSGPCPRCEDQAFVLSYMKNKYGDQLLVFALDSDIGDPSVKTLVTYYSVTEYPTLIVNGRAYTGFVSQQQLEEALNLGVKVIS